MEPLSLYLSLSQNRALNQDHATALRSLSLVQGETYNASLSLFSGFSQVAPTLSDFAFFLRTVGGSNVVSVNSVTQNGSGYNFTLPLTSPALASSSNYKGYFSFNAGGTVEIIEPFSVIAIPSPTTGGNTVAYVSSLNGLTSDIIISGSGSTSISQIGQSIIVSSSGESGGGVYYPNSNPSGFINSGSLTPYATIAGLTGTSGILQAELSSLNGQSGGYYPRSNPSGYLSSIPADVMRTSGTQVISGQKNFQSLAFTGNAFALDNLSKLQYNSKFVRECSVWAVSNSGSRFSEFTAVNVANGDVYLQEDTQHAYLVIDKTTLGDARGYVDLGAFVVAPVELAAPTLSTSAAPDNATAVSVTSNGTWEGTPSFSYQWQYSSDNTNWTNGSGQTSNTSDQTCSNIGEYMRLQFTATNAYGSVVLYLALTGTITTAAPTITDQPAIEGSPANGQTLTVDSEGCFAGCSLTYSYLWLSSTDQITWGAPSYSNTGNTYFTGAGDVGFYIKCTVTATNGGGSQSYDSDIVGPVANPPYVTTDVVIDDTTTSSNSVGLVGDTLAVEAEVVLAGGTPTSTTYQWYQNSSPLSGETNTSVSTAYYDQGSYYLVETNSNGDGSCNSTSNTITIEAGPANDVAPNAAGGVNVGNTINTDNGTWTGGGIAYTYQWSWTADETNWYPIGLANASSYTVNLTDGYVAGNYLKCTVTATNTASSASQDSNIVGPITNVPSVESDVVIWDFNDDNTGNGNVGDAIGINNGAVWYGDTSGGITYQWYITGGSQLTDDSQSQGVSIGEGDGLTTSTTGYYIVVTAEDAFGNTATSTSNTINLS